MSFVCSYGTCGGKSFNSRRDLKRHSEMVHDQQTSVATSTSKVSEYTADQKGFTAPQHIEFKTLSSDLSESDLDLFAKTFPDTTSWECSRCHQVLDDVRDLDEHAQECIMTELLYQCQDCKLNFKYLSALYEHVDKTMCNHEKTIGKSKRHESETTLTNGSEYEAVLFFDGAARPNPGNGGGGFILHDAFGRTLEERSLNILHGECTHTQAVYSALIKGMQVALSTHQIKKLLVLSECEVVINQMTAKYDIIWDTKDTKLVGLNHFAFRTATYFTRIDFKWIPARENAEASTLAAMGVRRQGSHEQLSLIS